MWILASLVPTFSTHWRAKEHSHAVYHYISHWRKRAAWTRETTLEFWLHDYCPVLTLQRKVKQYLITRCSSTSTGVNRSCASSSIGGQREPKWTDDNFDFLVNANCFRASTMSQTIHSDHSCIDHQPSPYHLQLKGLPEGNVDEAEKGGFLFRREKCGSTNEPAPATKNPEQKRKKSKYCGSAGNTVTQCPVPFVERTIVTFTWQPINDMECATYSNGMTPNTYWKNI